MNDKVYIISKVDYFYKIVKFVMPSLRVADKSVSYGISIGIIMFYFCDIFSVNMLPPIDFSRIGMDIKHVTALDKKEDEE